MNETRYQAWMIPMINVQQVNASPHTGDELVEAGKYGDKLWFYETLKGLARLDAQLVESDELISQRSISEIDPDELTDHITLSQLWTFGAYELIRTFRQKIEKENPSFEQIKSVVEFFGDIRIPLAKFEVKGENKKNASINRDEQYSIARPGFTKDQGLGWVIGKEEFTTRRELADRLIDCLSKYEHYYNSRFSIK